MKKALLHICIAVFAVSCAQNETTDSLDSNSISFKSSEISSRVSDNGYILSWRSGDNVAIALSDGSKTGIYQISDTQSGAMSYSSGDKHYTDGNNEQSFVSWSPTSLTPSGSLFSLDVETQSTTEPFIVATTTTSSNQASLIYNAIYTKVVFNLIAGGVDVTDLSGVTATLTGANTAGEYNYLTGEFSAQQSETLSITPEVATNGFTATATFYILETKSMNGQLNLYIGEDLYTTALTNREWLKGAMYIYDITIDPMTLADFGTTYTVDNLPEGDTWLISDQGDPSTEDFEGLRTLLQSITDRSITLLLPDLTSIPEYALQNNSSLSAFYAPKVEIIGQFAFSSCTGFTGDLTITGNLETVEQYLFKDCSNLNGTLTLEEGVRIIGGSAFYGCNFTGEIIFPSDMFFIGELAFTSPNLTSLVFIQSTPPAISNGAFPDQFKVYEAGDCYITIPAGATSSYSTNNWLLYNLKEQEN